MKMLESKSWIVSRYYEAAKVLDSLDKREFDRNRIFRLREDINAFRRDLTYLAQGGTFILAPDSAEIDSYIDPRNLIGYYCFPIEDRATFDYAFAKRERREALFDKENETRKIARRVLRASAHLFNSPRPNILLPPYLSELDVAISRILSERKTEDLDAVYLAIKNGILQLTSHDEELLQSLEALDDLSIAKTTELLDKIFDKVVANPVIFSDDMSLSNKLGRVSKIARANDFLNRTKSHGIEDYPWNNVIGPDNAELADQLKRITPNEILAHHIENLFFKLPSGTRTSLSVYADTRALTYVATINDLLHQRGIANVRAQLVTWALSPVTVARAFFSAENEKDGGPSLAEVRHPKLLAAAIDFANVNRTELERDLDRFSQALNLYEVGVEQTAAAGRKEQLSEVRRAWEQLDNTLLAWTAPIGETKTSSEVGHVSMRRLEKIREIVSHNRAAFTDYLASKIDALSKSLSDSHWLAIRPENVAAIRADWLLYEPQRCIILRPIADHARCAIAFYSRFIVDYIKEGSDQGTPFGLILVKLTEEMAFPDSDHTSRTIRAEIQLLKAFMFAIRADNVLAINYCRLARTELGPLAGVSQIRAEIDYLAHYACRMLGSAARSREEFEASLRFLNSSYQTWKSSAGKGHARLLPRYFISLMTTCLELAAAEIAEIDLEAVGKELLEKAYEGCLSEVETYDTARTKLDGYHVARAAQHVMLMYIFAKFRIGTWRDLFSTWQPREQDARRAWEILARIKSSQADSKLETNMRRIDLMYEAGNFLFGSATERDKARNELRGITPTTEKDSKLLAVATRLIRGARQP